MNESLWENQNRAVAKYGELVCGVDEAGRGPLAGPVCAAAVILSPSAVLEGLDDSKKLTEKKRELLFPKVIEAALAYCVAFVDNKTIDEINILQATMLCMQNAVEGLSKAPAIALVDGNRVPTFHVPTLAIVKGDSRLACIAAASVLAKVSRDRLMCEYDAEYPHYAFAVHKGYGTKLHYERIREHGVCPLHRLTFLKNMHYDK